MNSELNLQLENKYINNGNFMKQMINTSKKFKEFEQQAYYSELQQSSKSMIISVLADSELSLKLSHQRALDYFIFIGAKQPTGNNAIEKTLLNIIHLLPRPKKPYSIFYINTLAGKNSFEDFKKVTEFLTIQYFLNLSQIYVLHASFLSKATSWISFNIITSFVKEKTVHVNNFQQLTESASLDPAEFMKILPQQIQKELAKKEEFAGQILSYATKMIFAFGFQQTNKPENKEVKEIKEAKEAKEIKEIKEKNVKNAKEEKKQEWNVVQKEIQLFNAAVYKSSIVFLSSKKASKRHIEEYQVGQTGAPLPFQMLIYYFNQRDNLLNTEGIFRKSVSIDDQNQLLAEIDDQNYDFIQTVIDPHLIANAIKRFLSYLILPVVPYAQFMRMMEAQPDKLTQVVVREIRGLPDLRRKTFLLLLQFLMEKVIPKQNSNKMNIKNISIVIGPCLMRSEVSSIRDLIYSQKIIGVMLVIFKEIDAIFGNKKERMQALRKSAKDFNRAYLQDRLNNKPTEQFDKQALNFSKTEQNKQKIQPQSKLIRKMTYRLKEELMESNQKNEDEQFESIEDESQKELRKKIEQTIVDLSQAKISEEDFVDI